MSTAESVQLVGQKFLAGQGLDDDVQTGQNGVSLGQEVAIAQQFVLGNSGELAEFLLVFGVGGDEAEFTRTHSIF
jgi:hypothetical protein